MAKRPHSEVSGTAAEQAAPTRPATGWGVGGVAPSAAAGAAIAAGEAEAATPELQARLTGEAKQHALDWKEKGNACFKQGDFRGAVQCYDRAAEADPANWMLYSNRSAAHASLQQWALAERDASMLTRLAPTFAKGWGRLGSALLGQRRFEEAAPAFAKAAELDPANAEYKKQGESCTRQAGRGAGVAGDGLRGDFYAEKHRRLAMEEFKKGCFVASARYFSKALEAAPDDTVLLSNRAAANLKIAAQPGQAPKRAEEAYRSALEDGERCVQLRPGWGKGYARKGAALHGLKLFWEAKQAFEAGLAAEPGNSHCTEGLAGLEGQVKEFKQEEVKWEEAKKEHKESDAYLEKHPDACVIPDRKLPSVFCWKCGQEGHFPSNCTAQVQKGVVGGGYSNGYDQCFHCGQYGHTKGRCPERQYSGRMGKAGGEIRAPSPSGVSKRWAEAYQYKAPSAEDAVQQAGVTRREGRQDWSEGGKGGAAGGRR